jgi:hypothetical protein
VPAPALELEQMGQSQIAGFVVGAVDGRAGEVDRFAGRRTTLAEIERRAQHVAEVSPLFDQTREDREVRNRAQRPHPASPQHETEAGPRGDREQPADGSRQRRSQGRDADEHQDPERRRRQDAQRTPQHDATGEAALLAAQQRNEERAALFEPDAGVVVRSHGASRRPVSA